MKRFYLLLLAPLMLLAACEKEKNTPQQPEPDPLPGSAERPVVLPGSESEPILPGDERVFIGGEGFKTGQELWFFPPASTRNANGVRATIQEVTAEGIYFKAPEVYGRQKALLREGERESELGFIFFKNSLPISNYELPEDVLMQGELMALEADGLDASFEIYFFACTPAGEKEGEGVLGVVNLSSDAKTLYVLVPQVTGRQMVVLKAGYDEFDLGVVTCFPFLNFSRPADGEEIVAGELLVIQGDGIDLSTGTYTWKVGSDPMESIAMTVIGSNMIGFEVPEKLGVASLEFTLDGQTYDFGTYTVVEPAVAADMTMTLTFDSSNRMTKAYMNPGDTGFPTIDYSFAYSGSNVTITKNYFGDEVVAQGVISPDGTIASYSTTEDWGDGVMIETIYVPEYEGGKCVGTTATVIYGPGDEDSFPLDKLDENPQQELYWYPYWDEYKDMYVGLGTGGPDDPAPDKVNMNGLLAQLVYAVGGDSSNIGIPMLIAARLAGSTRSVLPTIIVNSYSYTFNVEYVISGGLVRSVTLSESDTPYTINIVYENI